MVHETIWRGLASADVDRDPVGWVVVMVLPEHFGNGKEMMPFQKDGLGFVEAANGNAMIADQPGLGKTCESLAYIGD